MVIASHCFRITSIIPQHPSCITNFRTWPFYPLPTRTRVDLATSESNANTKARGNSQRKPESVVVRGKADILIWETTIEGEKNLFSLMQDCEVLTQLWTQWRGRDSPKDRQSIPHKTVSLLRKWEAREIFLKGEEKARHLFYSSKGRKKQMNQKSKIEYHWSCWQSNQQSPHSKYRGLLNKAKDFKSLEQNKVFQFVKLDIILEQHFDLGAVKNFCIKNI